MDRRVNPLRRSLRRLGFLLGLLGATNVAVAWRAPARLPVFDRSYRLPSDRLPLLSAYVRHIRATKRAHPSEPIAVFLGASPTWGTCVDRLEATLPYAYQATWQQHQPSRPLRVYNLALPSNRLSDSYYTLQAVIDSADVVFCEVFYRFLNPQSGDQTHPELPGLLEASLSLEEQQALHLKRGALLQSWAEAKLRQTVPLYRERDMLNLWWFGGSPGPALLGIALRLAGRDSARAERPKPIQFERLPDAEKRQIVAYNQDLYRVGPLRDDSVHLFFLRQIAQLIRAYGKYGVAFSPPLYRAFLDEYHLIEWQEYRDNMARVRDLCEKEGLRFVDCNDGPERLDLPGRDFHDAAHTLDTGAQRTGEHLYRLTCDSILLALRR